MKRSLFAKFIVTYIVVGVLSFMVVAILSSGLTYHYLVRTKADQLYNASILLASSYSETDPEQGEDTIRQQMEVIADVMDLDVWILDRNGKVLIDSDEDRHKDAVIPEFDSTMTGMRYVTGTCHGLFSEDMLSVMAPVTRGYTTGGYVVLHQSMQSIELAQNEILNIVYVTALILFILSLLILAVFYVIVYRPLKRITEGATKYAAGDYSYRIQSDAQDEMGYLAETLNFMSEEISKSDDYQKQFIANVSHDFRSPLTSIKGYLEAILDGTIPKELEPKYLMRLISETERLTKLTQSMLSLGTLDKKGFLSRTNFDINRMIRDVCASFEMTCQKKELVFELTFAEKKEMVYADYSKIQQVLYNLIDNALKFSNPKSSIAIKTGLRGTKVFVSVKDTGIGIPKREISKIWDRFYKADQSRGKDKHGTGLGLSIVKSIITAHDENIDCVSTEGVGTEFTFTLPQAVYQEAE